MQRQHKHIVDFHDPRKAELVKYIVNYSNIVSNASFAAGYILGHGYATQNLKNIIYIDRLVTKNLKTTIKVLIEADDEGFLAQAVDIPLYGYGDDKIEAMTMLKREIESLYNELTEGDNFSDEWIQVKKYLNSIVSD